MPKGSSGLSKEIIAAIITALATLVAALITGIFVLRSTSNGQAQPSNPITPAVIVTNQPTRPPPNRTITPQPAPSQVVNSGPYGGTLVLNDPLQDNSQGNHWDTAMEPNGSSCGFKNGAYTVFAAQNSFLECNTNASNTVFSNFAFQISMTIVQGDPFSGAEGGIAFRYDDSTKSFYAFMIDASDTYQLYVFINNAYILLQHGDAISQFHNGVGETNLIAVVANESNIEVFINQSQDPLFSILDTHLSSGQIGVIAQGSQQSVGEVTFSNAQVWQL